MYRLNAFLTLIPFFCKQPSKVKSCLCYGKLTNKQNYMISELQSSEWFWNENWILMLFLITYTLRPTPDLLINIFHFLSNFQLTYGSCLYKFIPESNTEVAYTFHSSKQFKKSKNELQTLVFFVEAGSMVFPMTRPFSCVNRQLKNNLKNSLIYPETRKKRKTIVYKPYGTSFQLIMKIGWRYIPNNSGYFCVVNTT